MFSSKSAKAAWILIFRETGLGDNISAKQAESLKNELERLESNVGQESEELVTILEQLAYSLHAGGEYTEAEQYYERSLHIRKSRLSSDSKGIIYCLHSLGVLKRLQSQFEHSEPYYREAL
ncbi:MAG: tetratricopeptide repeat protein, partial [Cyanobacteria bacterium]|nr:tetratricopeptide repeat protein [Cyanobacteriota bacterium]